MVLALFLKYHNKNNYEIIAQAVSTVKENREFSITLFIEHILFLDS